MHKRNIPSLVNSCRVTDANGVAANPYQNLVLNIDIIRNGLYQILEKQEENLLSVFLTEQEIMMRLVSRRIGGDSHLK